MIYPYICNNDLCKHQWDVIKAVAHIDNPETCEKCSSLGSRQISFRVHFSGLKVEEYEYQPAFGKWVRGKQQRDELAKIHGMVEIGNENPDKLMDTIDRDRERKLEQRYDEI